MEPVKIQSPAEDNRKFETPGDENFKDISTEFVSVLSKRQMTERHLKIGRYIP